MELAQNWIEHCLQHHDLCRAGSPLSHSSPSPTRLVNVENPNRPFLVETGRAPGIPYVALSYCWGDSRRVLTLKKNSAAHRASIPLADLPRTFKDAIHVTHALGYKHLWTDALCIIQDCNDDKAYELARMGGIYRYAEFTIYAERAQSSDSGLFEERDNRAYRPCEISFTISTAGAGNGGSGDITRIETVTVAGACNGPDFLQSRGWILQEEIMASRRLIFGRQMAWKCTGGEARETRPVPRDRRDTATVARASKLDQLRLWLYAPQLMSGGDDTSGSSGGVGGVGGARRSETQQRKQQQPWHRHSRFDAWYAVLEGFSLRNLTVASDTLPCLTGLATLFAEAHGGGGRYVAGLWAEDLQLGLGWYVVTNDDRPVPRGRAGGDGGGGGVVPSWSWASLEGGVRIRYRPRRPRSENSAEEGARILDAVCTPKEDTNPFGGVKGGRLRVRSRVRKAILRCSRKYSAARAEFDYAKRNTGVYEPIAPQVHPRFPGLIVDVQSGDAVGEAALDMPMDPLSSGSGNRAGKEVDECGTEVWCMLLQVQKKEDERDITCLILEQIEGGSHVYRRLGLGFMAGLSWFQESGRQGESSAYPARTDICEIV